MLLGLVYNLSASITQPGTHPKRSTYIATVSLRVSAECIQGPTGLATARRCNLIELGMAEMSSREVLTDWRLPLQRLRPYPNLYKQQSGC